MKKPKLLGIVGGMGSHATASLFQNLVKKCPASNDREYMEIIIHNNSRIPDRTDAILNGGEDAFPEILRSVRMLHSQGADHIIFACVTAYYYFDRLKKAEPDAGIINLFDVVAEYIHRIRPDIGSIGVLASAGVVHLELWPRRFSLDQLKVVQLQATEQETLVTGAIYGARGLKSGFISEPKEKLLTAASRLRELGAEAILSSCSELPIAIEATDFDIPFVDCFDILTDYVIDLFYV